MFFIENPPVWCFWNYGNIGTPTGVPIQVLVIFKGFEKNRSRVILKEFNLVQMSPRLGFQEGYAKSHFRSNLETIGPREILSEWPKIATPLRLSPKLLENHWDFDHRKILPGHYQEQRSSNCFKLWTLGSGSLWIEGWKRLSGHTCRNRPSLHAGCIPHWGPFLPSDVWWWQRPSLRGQRLGRWWGRGQSPQSSGRPSLRGTGIWPLLLTTLTWLLFHKWLSLDQGARQHQF